MLLDCVTVMVTNLMLEDSVLWDCAGAEAVGAAEKRINDEIDDLILSARRFSGMTVIVSNETGMGIVPADPLSRHFRDIAGRINQKLAACADEAYFAVSGIPVKIKGEK
ncbi:MAG: bifunctional adenosylcobinamide kinase/adenosylcobinamide-phosphate guanylyltransferase [Spirochaetota bacterium]